MARSRLIVLAFLSLGWTVASVAAQNALAEPHLPSGDAPATSHGAWFLAFMAAVGLLFYLLGTKRNREKEWQKLTDVAKLIEPTITAIEAEFPFVIVSEYGIKNGLGFMFMDRQGERLRFVDFSADGKVKTQDLIVPVSSIISVELSGGNEVITEYETTSTKPNALAGAILGGLAYGQVGAIVGATAAGSEATSTAKQRVVERPSVLVFGLSDLNNPVVRFSSMDHVQCDIWLHRVRSARSARGGVGVPHA